MNINGAQIAQSLLNGIDAQVSRTQATGKHLR
jgi:hypothetical protein